MISDLTQIPLLFLDDNVFDPISRRGQESTYEQLADLLGVVESTLTNGFDPCYGVPSFFERIGAGNCWEKVNVYEGISIPLKAFEDKEELANQVFKISQELFDKIKSHAFFSQINLTELYEKSCSNFVGNEKSDELLNRTFHRFGKAICYQENHLNLINYDLWWDRLVAFPLLWNKLENVQELRAKETWLRAEKFYDYLFAIYHNQNLIHSGAPFTRLVLHRRLVHHLLRLKYLRHERKSARWINKLTLLYQIRQLEGWVKKYKWAFKPNSDLVDIQLMHFALFGFSILNKENSSDRVSGVCVTCDPIEVVEQRLFLCLGSHNELTQRVEGWNLPLRPGKIICLRYQNYKFSHVKTFDVAKYLEECNSWKNWINGLKFKLKLGIAILKESIKATVSRSQRHTPNH